MGARITALRKVALILTRELVNTLAVLNSEAKSRGSKTFEYQGMTLEAGEWVTDLVHEFMRNQDIPARPNREGEEGQ